MSQKYVELAFLQEVKGTVEELMKEEGGSIELARLEQLLNAHYHYPIKGRILTEKEVNENP